MQGIRISDIRAARTSLRPYIRHTPLHHSPSLSRRFSRPLYLKLENWQTTGSFKIRGALNKLLTLSKSEKIKGVITASAGNHGLGVAHAAGLLGIHARIVVPETASKAKAAALRNYDIELIEQGADYDEAEQVAYEIQQREGLTFVHAFSDPQVIAGQGTAGLEIVSDLPDVETIVVPVGGGGLISGLACAVKAHNPRTRVIGVQSEASPAMVCALEAGRVVETPIAATLADGLAGRFVTELTRGMTQAWVDDVVLVSERAIAEAMRLLFENEHLLLEASAAVGVAWLLEADRLPPGKLVCVLTGRNIAAETLKSVI